MLKLKNNLNICVYDRKTFFNKIIRKSQTIT